jgi:signal transduction histidine kinase
MRLMVAIMLVVTAATAIGLAFAQRAVGTAVKREFQARFESDVDSLTTAQRLRNAVLAERCRSLSRRPRIHAALEDNALDLLYPSAKDELADLMGPAETSDPAAASLKARFYRFLDGSGRVIAPPDPRQVGELSPAEEAQLALARAPERPQMGYLLRAGNPSVADEIIAMPIVSSDTGEVIAAVVLGFPASDGNPSPPTLRRGFCVQGHVVLSGSTLSPGEASEVISAIQSNRPSGESLLLGDPPQLLFERRINPQSLYPPAYELSLFSLAALMARQARLFLEFAGMGALLLVGTFPLSHLVSGRFSRPVEQLAMDSEVNRLQRARAETALEARGRELERAARFSADASHQLKTPVTVLRAGLEELLSGEQLTPELREEVSSLVHQTFRLTSVIEDLLLLSRMEAGRMRISFEPISVAALVEASVDDLQALEDPLHLKLETDVPADLKILAERRYAALILQNLVENARKYNRPGGRIRIEAKRRADGVAIVVGNSGVPIPEASREHIFDRFHRGAMGENIPGHGLGLNLARELVRLHGGDLTLVGSDGDWTEFEASFKAAV